MPTIVTFLVLLITGFTGLEFSKQGPSVIPVQHILLETVPLASASHFTVLAGTSITSQGDTRIAGEIGLSPGNWVSGFPKEVLYCTDQNNSTKSLQAKVDLLKAYTDAQGRKSKDIVTLKGNIGGLTLTPGLYKSAASLQISAGDLTFDAMGKKDAIFIIQIANTLNTRPHSKVILKGGASASNIFWQVGNAANFGSDSDFKGTVLAFKSIKFYSDATLEGRAFASTGEVDLTANKIVKQ